jgi:NAD(P)-dependent dehydrogenase (short-subunit alcohol dehydrogenase family)
MWPEMAVVVLTGCSSGFGLEGALAFARSGDRVYATLRTTKRATELVRAAEAEKLSVIIKALDVTQAATFPRILGEIVDDAGRIDVLVNNAGVSQAAAFEDVRESTLRDVMETNCLGPLLLTQAVLPIMRRQRGGLIIMMSSLSGVAGLPGDVAYSASKFALEGATEALRHEVDRWGIRVALVEAGSYATRILENSLQRDTSVPDEHSRRSPYRPLIEYRLRRLRERLEQGRDPRLVANLFVTIARSDATQLRWPADEVASNVLSTIFAHDDAARDEFLRGVAGSDWWSRGENSA